APYRSKWTIAARRRRRTHRTHLGGFLGRCAVLTRGAPTVTPYAYVAMPELFIPEDLMAQTVSRRLLFVSIGAAAMGLALTNRGRKVAAEEAAGTFVLVNRDWHGDVTHVAGGATTDGRPVRSTGPASTDAR